MNRNRRIKRRERIYRDLGEEREEENKEKYSGKCEEKAGKLDGQVYAYSVNSGDRTETHVEHRQRNSGQLFENLTWLTSNEAAEYLRLPSVGALRVLVFKRQVPFHKLGRNLRFKKCELDRLLDASRTGGI